MDERDADRKMQTNRNRQVGGAIRKQKISVRSGSPGGEEGLPDQRELDANPAAESEKGADTTAR